MKLLDGKKVAAKILQRLTAEIKRLPSLPKLGIILVGENAASVAYIRAKIKACNQIGLLHEQINCSSKISEESLIETIRKINNNRSFHGMIVQLPLPAHIDTNRIIFEIDHFKDVDGFHPFNLGKMFVGLPSLAPCTPLGILELLQSYRINLTGKNIVVIGKSNIVGKPLVTMLLNRHATVTTCDKFTRDLRQHCKKADIIVSATGAAHLINGSFVKKGAILVDVGFSFKHGKVCGDIDPKSVAKKAAYLSPVPGGVGPMTVALLLQNTVEAYRYQNGLVT